MSVMYFPNHREHTGLYYGKLKSEGSWGLLTLPSPFHDSISGTALATGGRSRGGDTAPLQDTASWPSWSVGFLSVPLSVYWAHKDSEGPGSFAGPVVGGRSCFTDPLD